MYSLYLLILEVCMSNKKNENSGVDNLKPLGDITVDGQPLFSDQNLTDVADFLSATDQFPFRPLTMDDLNHLK